MKIVQIEDFFHPDAGYQINVLSKVLASRGHDVTIVCALNLDIFPESLRTFFGTSGVEESDKLYSEKYGVKILRVPAKGYYSGRALFGSETYHLIESLNPNVLFVHGNDSLSGMYYAWKASKLSFPVVMDSHMLEVATKNRFANLYRAVYRLLFASRINAQRIKVIRVQDDPYVIDKLGIDRDNAPYIGFGSDTDLFYPDEGSKQAGRHRYGIPLDAIVVLYAGKLDESKGGMLLARALEKRFESSSLYFVIAGNASGERAKEFESLISKSENRVLRLPTHKYPDLPKLYQIADLALFPAQCSLSYFDVQASGLPVIVDDGTPVNTDRVSHGNGFQFQEGSVEGLRTCIETYAGLSLLERERLKEASVRLIRDNYSYDHIAELYEECFEKAISDYLRTRR